MPPAISELITNYGYLAVFILIFLQETGFPSPVPNELLLMFTGYLSYRGLLYLPVAILTALIADFIGTNVLYFIFYFTGDVIVQKKPRWIPISQKVISEISSKVEKKGLAGIFLFRLTPFTRGYSTVVTGLLRIKPARFLPIAFFSTLIWSSFYIVTGYLVGPSWNCIEPNLKMAGIILLSILSVTMIIYIALQILKVKKKKLPDLEN
jgi:membrane protein DedA with SNARE-associated domain